MNRSRVTPPGILPFVTGLGSLGVLVSYFTVDPARFWANWLLWFLAVLTVGLGALFIVALAHLVGARWSVPIRRVPERLSGLVVFAAPLAVIALCALPVLYPWAGSEAAHNPIVAGKAAWLNVPFSPRVSSCASRSGRSRIGF